MSRPERPPSHPVVGWGFVGLGVMGLVWSLAAYGVGCRQDDLALWPIGPEQLAVLDAVARVALPMALVAVLGILLPLQRWAGDVRHHDRLARLVTAVLLLQLGGSWLWRLNRIGFASLWSRREVVGDLVLPAAVLENRVWSANIMLVLLVALLALPVHRWVRASLRRTDGRRLHWSLWVVSGLWWVGLASAALLAAGR